MGYLTGTITPSTTFYPTEDLRVGAEFPRFTKEAISHSRPVVDLLARLGQRKDATPGQVDLAWMLPRKPWIVPIPGTTKISHMKEDFGAVNIQLSEAHMSELEAGFAQLTVEGKRAPEALMAIHDVGVNFGTSSAGTHGNSPLRE